MSCGGDQDQLFVEEGNRRQLGLRNGKQAESEVQSIRHESRNNLRGGLRMDLEMHAGESLLELRDQRRNQIGIHGGQSPHNEPAPLRSVQFTNQLSGLLHFAKRPLRMVTKEDARLSERDRAPQPIEQSSVEFLFQISDLDG